MWLLRLHIAISILLLLTGEGAFIVFRKIVIDNGWEVSKGIKRIICFIKRCLMYFIPLINFLIIITTLIMIFVKKEKYEKEIKERVRQNNK